MALRLAATPLIGSESSVSSFEQSPSQPERINFQSRLIAFFRAIFFFDTSTYWRSNISVACRSCPRSRLACCRNLKKSDLKAQSSQSALRVLVSGSRTETLESWLIFKGHLRSVYRWPLSGMHGMFPSTPTCSDASLSLLSSVESADMKLLLAVRSHHAHTVQPMHSACLAVR